MLTCKEVENQSGEINDSFSDKLREVCLNNLHIPGCLKCLFCQGGEDILSFLNSVRDFHISQINIIDEKISCLEPLGESDFPFMFDKNTQELTLIITEDQFNLLRDAGKINCSATGDPS